jgi:hypothetical protein
MMPPSRAAERWSSPGPLPDRVILRCDDSGCTLTVPEGERRFPDVEAARDSARNAQRTQAATIEIWQDDEYICCLAPRQIQCAELAFPSLYSPVFRHRHLMVAERRAERLAGFWLAIAGPMFWAALVLLVIAASLGWHLPR